MEPGHGDCHPFLHPLVRRHQAPNTRRAGLYLQAAFKFNDGSGKLPEARRFQAEARRARP